MVFIPTPLGRSRRPVVERGSQTALNRSDPMQFSLTAYNRQKSAVGLAVMILLQSLHALAQIPLYTREFHVQHNGSGNSVMITLPALTAPYGLTLPPSQGAAGSVLSNDGSGNLSWTASLSAIGSTGSTNYVPLFTSTTTVGNSTLYQDGTSIGLGTTTPGASLHINTASATTKGLIVRATSSATANLFEAQNSSGISVFEVSSSGNLARINNVAYTWPSSLPAAATSGTQLGSGIFTISSAGTVSFRQAATASAELDFPVTATRTSSDLTITITGAASGDMVALGVPNAATLANTCYTAWVSADNTVTIRFNNFDNADKNPASATFKVMVFK